MELKLNCVSPWDREKPHPGQAEFLTQNYLGPRINRVDLVTGRGFGKTRAAVLLAFHTMLDDPGTVGVITAPTHGELRKAFLASWKRVVPNKLYKHNQTHGYIEFINGSIMWLDSRQVANPSRGKEAARGEDACWAIEDEAAIGFDPEQYTNLDATLRHPGKYRFHVTISTPRLGNMYYHTVTQDSHTLLHYSMRDNPHLPVGFVDDVASEMTEQQIQREILGNWVSLDGMIWSGWSNERWPNGNIHDHVHNPSMPYYLFFDIGVASSAWALVQRLPMDIWCITAEYTPKRDGSIDKVLKKIKEDYGNPCRVIAGADLGTRDSNTGRTSAWFVRNILGGDIPITSIDASDWRKDKEIQLTSLSRAIKTAMGRRKLCVSAKLQSHDPKMRRGCLEVFNEDTWPENTKKKEGELLPKEGRLEHMRDALLYGAVGVMEVPRYTYSTDVAA